jgi:hypothetical protein
MAGLRHRVKRNSPLAQRLITTCYCLNIAWRPRRQRGAFAHFQPAYSDAYLFSLTRASVYIGSVSTRRRSAYENNIINNVWR